MVVHPHSRGVPRAPRYSGYGPLLSVFGYGALTPSGRPSHAVPLTCRRSRPSLPQALHAPRAPRFCRLSTLSCRLPTAPALRVDRLVWPPPRSLATTCGISVDVFSSPYLDVSVRAVPRARLFCSARAGGAFPRRVPPFGNLRIYRVCAAPRSLSQLVASFVGS